MNKKTEIQDLKERVDKLELKLSNLPKFDTQEKPSLSDIMQSAFFGNPSSWILIPCAECGCYANKADMVEQPEKIPKTEGKYVIKLYCRNCKKVKKNEQ